MSRPRRLVATIIVAAAALTGLIVQSPGAGAAPEAAATSSAGSIQHLIVVLQSGHSFDNYFGTRPGVDGIPAGVCEPIGAGSKTCVKPYHLSPDGTSSGLSSTVRSMTRAVNGGKMDGFVTAQANTSIGTSAMGYYNGLNLPYYWSLADHFTLFDHFYAGALGGALPNRLIAIAGQDANVTSGTPPVAGVNVPTVFDRLDQAGMSWKYYVQGYQGQSSVTPAEKTRAPVLAIPAVAGNATRVARITSTNQYFSDLLPSATGAIGLPTVSYITGSLDSERSPQDPAKGAAFVRSLITALMQSPAWPHTALLLTYDDAGGWYDHAVPPAVGGAKLGLRVPAMLVSPYARPGFVDHDQVDTASIPGLIEQTFHLRPLTRQDAVAGSLLGAVDLRQHPTPAFLGSPTDAATVVGRPDVHTIYTLYLLAFGGTGLLVALAFLRQRRDNRRSPRPQPAQGAA